MLPRLTALGSKKRGAGIARSGANEKLEPGRLPESDLLNSQMFSYRLRSSRLGFEQRRHVRGRERDAASVDAGGVEEGGSDCWRPKRVSGF